MRQTNRLGLLNPLRLLHSSTRYQLLPSSDVSTALPNQSLHKPRAFPRREGLFPRRKWLSTLTGVLVGFTLGLALLIGWTLRTPPAHMQVARPPREWEDFRWLVGYYNGVRSLVDYDRYEAENGYNVSRPIGLDSLNITSKTPSLGPIAFRPYPDYAASEYLDDHHKVETCHLDDDDTIMPPDIYVYPGVPQYAPSPFFGSFEELGLSDDMCFDRFGRFGPYGYGYDKTHGGLGLQNVSEDTGSEQVFEQMRLIDYTNIDWRATQGRCFEKNRARFSHQQPDGHERVPRHAYVLRTWIGYEYSAHQILSLRAMISELALRSGGEYDVHLLVHVKDSSIPIWADENVYNETLQRSVPREFWGISTLWSEQQMSIYYPEPFPDNFWNYAGSGIHGVYRSAHFPLQWFSQQHPEYDFIWNWEMDVRYTGHYYDFNSKIGEWAKKQPRKGLWQRNAQFWIPKYHGDYANFTKSVEQDTREQAIGNNLVENGPLPVWGPARGFNNSGMIPSPDETIPPTSYDDDHYEWGAGEDADLVVFNPIFDPSKSEWVFRDDVTGYNKSFPIPPRRAAIVTASRLSRRLLDLMHRETWEMRHTMFSEMWPSTVAFHHGLKAVYVPHPVFYDRDWDVAYMDQVFNRPESDVVGPFSHGEILLQGSTYYYNSGFAGALWRRWLGLAENGQGGREEEEQGSGRICLRGTLFHPVKSE